MKNFLLVCLVIVGNHLFSQSKIDMKCRYDAWTNEGQGKTMALIKKYFEKNIPDSIFPMLEPAYLKSNPDIKKDIVKWTGELSHWYVPFSFHCGEFECEGDCKNHYVRLFYRKNNFHIYVIKVHLNHNDQHSKISKIEFENKLAEFMKKQKESDDEMPPSPTN